MPNLTANIDFTAVFDTAARTLTLQNTGNYAGVSVTTVWAVRLVEAGIVRTAAGGTAGIALPQATDGTIPQLVYEFTCTVNDGTDDSSLTRSFAYSMQPQQPELSQFLNYTAPRLVYADAQEYYQTGYNIPSVVRSWTALRAGQTVPVVSTTVVLDLAVGGNYYAGQYAVGLVVTATYKPAAADKQWVTVVATYSINDAVVPYVWPTVPEILGWVNSTDEKGCGCELGCQPANLYGLFKDNYCNGNYEAAERNLQALYKATHNGQRYKPRRDGALLVGVSICGSTTAVAPFIFATQPTSGTAPTTLTAAVSGGVAPYMYQWYNGTVAITAATGTSYSATTAGSYKVVATDSAGTVITSSVAVVGAGIQPLRITQQPQNQTVQQGATATFGVAVSGGVTPYQYYWQVSTDGGVNYNAINGANASTFSVSNGQDGYLYRCYILDDVGSVVISQAATLNVTTMTGYTASIGFSPNGIDPYTSPTGSPSGITYIASVTISNPNDAITFLKSTPDFAKLADNFIVLQMDTAIGNRTLVANGGFGPYTIPAQEFARNSAVGGTKWIVSNNTWALSSNDDLVFTH